MLMTAMTMRLLCRWQAEWEGWTITPINTGGDLHPLAQSLTPDASNLVAKLFDAACRKDGSPEWCGSHPKWKKAQMEVALLASLHDPADLHFHREACLLNGFDIYEVSPVPGAEVNIAESLQVDFCREGLVELGFRTPEFRVKFISKAYEVNHAAILEGLSSCP